MTGQHFTLGLRGGMCLLGPLSLLTRGHHLFLCILADDLCLLHCFCADMLTRLTEKISKFSPLAGLSI